MSPVLIHQAASVNRGNRTSVCIHNHLSLKFIRTQFSPCSDMIDHSTERKKYIFEELKFYYENCDIYISVSIK